MQSEYKKRASKKIAKLIKKGKPKKQAVAAGYNMAKKGKVGPKGGYKKKG